MNFLKKALIFLIVLPFAAPFSVALGANGGGQDVLEESARDLTLVGVMGAGGGLLGLSTLSFVDRPGDHLDNITVGAALGIIAGVCWVAYGQAMNTYEELGVERSNPFYFDRGDRWDRMVAFRGKRFSHSKGRRGGLMSWSWRF